MDSTRRTETARKRSLPRFPRTTTLLRGLLGVLLLAALLSVQAAGNPQRWAGTQENSTPARVQAVLSKLPLYFIENRGQVDGRVAYYVQGKDTSLYFTPVGVTFVLTKPQSSRSGSLSAREKERLQPVALRPEPQASEEPQRWTLKLDFVGANLAVTPQGQELTPAVVSYFKGTPDQWQTGLPTYRSVVYPNLWPGIDLVYSGTGNRLKYTFRVKPGADPKQIKLAYRGTTGVTLTDSGQLQVTTPLGGFSDDTPYAYQDVNGQRVEVAAVYTLEAETATDAQVYGFQVGRYDATRELILDPTVVIFVYAGYIGGSGNDFGNGIAVDSAGNAYVTGYSDPSSTSFPIAVGPDLTLNNNTDAFVAKVKADGTGLVYAGYIGGGGEDYGNSIAVDSAGNAYVTGYTSSSETSFPVTVGPDLTFNGGVTGGLGSDSDAFVAKVKADGTGLVYAGYIGGSGNDVGTGIAVDSGGNAYVTGSTSSPEASFPVKVGPDLTYNGGAADAFVAKVKADGTGLVYAGYIGGGVDAYGTGIAVDSGGNAYVTGYTNSSEASFPVKGGPDLTYNGGGDAFVAKVKADGTGLVYAGYIGGAGNDVGTGIAVDSGGNAYITGWTNSPETSFPVKVGPDLTFNGGVMVSPFAGPPSDAFVAKVKADGTGLIYAGYIGGSGNEIGTGIAVDSGGNAYITGWTNSLEASFPVTVGPDLTYNGGDGFARQLISDAFVAKVKADGTGLVYAGYIGGSENEVGTGIAVDSTGNAYVTGHTSSPETSFPVTVGPDLTFNGGVGSGVLAFDAFVARVVMTETPLVAALLPSSRSVMVGTQATVLVSVINTGSTTATAVGISLRDALAATLDYQTTDPLTNLRTGTLNTPVDIPAGHTQNYVIGLTPTASFAPTDVEFNFAGPTTPPAPIFLGVNTLLLSASDTPVPDIVALAATCHSNDGIPLTVNIPGVSGTGAFAVATVNVGAAADITVTADASGGDLPSNNLTLCQTNPVTGACLAPPSGSVVATMGAGTTATFSIFVKGTGTAIPFDPATKRIFVRFKDAGNVVRGATSVAVRTHSPACAP